MVIIMSAVCEKLAHELAGQEKPHNASILLSYAKARDIDGMIAFLKRLSKEAQQ